MSERPFWSAKGVGLLCVAAAALSVIPAATRLAPTSWTSVLNSPQWWSNLRMMGESTCMTPLYGRDATIREHMFEPSCAYGWGARGHGDYAITQVRYRFEEATAIELTAHGDVALEPGTLAVFGLPVRPPDRRSSARSGTEHTTRTLSWWGVKAHGVELDRVDLSETTSGGSRQLTLQLHVNRYVYDTTHLRDERDEPTLGLALPEGMTRGVRDRPNAWLSGREVGVREGYDTTGSLLDWPRMKLEDPEVDRRLGGHLKRHEASQRVNAQLMLYAGRSVTASRLIEMTRRARALGFGKLSLFALREEVSGSAREQVGDEEHAAYAEPMTTLTLGESRATFSLEVTLEGFEVMRETPEGMARIAPLKGCDARGVTVCLKPGAVEPGEAFSRAAREDDAGELERGREALLEGLERFDFYRLHVLMGGLQQELVMGGVLALRLGDGVPVGLITRTLTAVRIKRGPETSPGSGVAEGCVQPPPDEETMWGWEPCPVPRDISVQLVTPEGQGR